MRVADTHRGTLATAAAAVGIVTAAIAAHLLPAVESFEPWLLRALRLGVTGSWLALLAFTFVDMARAALRKSGALAPLPAWRTAVLVTVLIVPRFRADLTSAPAAAFWLVLLLVCGAAVTREVAGSRALRPFWLASAVFVAPWGLLTNVPTWP